MKIFSLNGVKFFAIQVPETTLNHELKWSKYSDHFHINYDFDRTSPYTSGGFCVFFKDFGGRKKYPLKGTLEIIGIANYYSEYKSKLSEYGIDDFSDLLLIRFI